MLQFLMQLKMHAELRLKKKWQSLTRLKRLSDEANVKTQTAIARYEDNSLICLDMQREDRGFNGI
jgi:hypothetical protein